MEFVDQMMMAVDLPGFFQHMHGNALLVGLYLRRPGKNFPIPAPRPSLVVKPVVPDHPVLRLGVEVVVVDPRIGR